MSRGSCRGILCWSLLVAVGGCQSLPGSSGADQAWVRDLERADSLVVRTRHGQVRMTDPAEVARLRGIYSNAEWEVYWHTLPADVAARSIDVCLAGETLRSFSYTTGVLWESTGYDENRTADMQEVDRQWVESLFAVVPDGESPGQN